MDQREALAQKGEDAHLLLMTATPIPRTLAMTLYGDLDVSTLKGMPPGRGDLTTHWLRGPERRGLSKKLLPRLERGEQVFWVCPRITGDAGGRTAWAERRYEQALAADLAQFGVELAHGRIPAEERSYRLDRFRSGEVGLLVATTVIEVGVDVAAATVMVIEHAERFGLAQLHQLRGRIGRGEAASTCLLLYAAPLGETARARIKILRETDDGFRIAEEDLRLRGAGEVLGTRQSGLPDFRLADLAIHGDLLAAARDDARLILARDEKLETPRGEALRTLLYLFERDAAVKYLRSG